MFALVRFEIVRRLGRASTWMYVAIFFALGFLLVGGAGGALGGVTVDFGTGSKVAINSPFSLSLLLPLAGHFGVLITAAIAGRAICDDLEHHAAPFFYTTPISDRRFLAGRFLGALAVMLCMMPAIGAGAWAATHLPGLDPARVGSNRLIAYVAPYLIVLLPNLFFTTAIFFSVAVLSRRMLPVYVGAVVLLIGYLIGTSIAGDMENRMLAAMVDPFGLEAIDVLAAYWPVAERNTRIVPLAGVLLANRVLWTGVGALLLAVAARRFSFVERGGRGATPTGEGALDLAVPASTVALPEPKPDYTTRSSLELLVSLWRLQLRETVRSVFFAVIVLAGVLFIASTASSIGRLFGTPTYPVTYQVLETVGGSFSVFVVLVITIYSGELVWRERTVGLSPIYDALPVPRWVTSGSKLGALVAVVFLLQAVVLVSGVALQVLNGYFHFEIGLYLRTLYLVQLPGYACLCVLAVLVHVLVNNKYLGHVVLILYFVASITLPRFGFEHHLYLYATAPPFKYSDMNGFGHFVAPLFWFRLYWTLVAVLLALAAHLAWVQGVEGGFRARLRMARSRVSKRARATAALVTLLAACVGGFIYHNTNRLNRYRTTSDERVLWADYERLYKGWDVKPQPRVVGIVLDADLFPEERRLVVRGTTRLVSRAAAPIAEVAVTFSTEGQLDELRFDRASRVVLEDRRLGFTVHELTPPLAPGEKLELAWRVTHARVGFTNGESDTHIVHNGTFVPSSYFPRIGYDPELELGDEDARHREGLGPHVRMADLDDAERKQRNYVSADGDWIDFDATVRTAADQMAVAPGELVKSWDEGGRRAFHYRTRAPTLDIYGLLSARWAARRDRWNDVEIEIDYHPDHTWDLDSMVRGIKDTLAYATERFGPYQNHAVRIVEFPRYDRFAQSLAATIPYSEAVGFVARIERSKPDAIDYPYYITAHEVGHQWWAHQIIGADVQGATVLSESLAQYTALMVMQRTFGPASMARFLRYELDRYLRSRGQEKQKELPLLRVENQPYVHYSKGSLVMYAVQDYLGEDVVARVLADLVASYRLRGPPYPTSRDLYDRLRAAAPPEMAGTLADLFERITLWDARAVSATMRESGPRAYEVTLRFAARKLRADELGVETEVPVDDLVDVGVLDAQGKPLALERRRIHGGEDEVTLHVSGIPAKAGIDPLNKLIDRKPDDNLVAVERK